MTARFVVGKHQLMLANLIQSGLLIFTCDQLNCNNDTWHKLCEDSHLLWKSPKVWQASEQSLAWAEKVIAHKSNMRVRNQDVEERANMKRKLKRMSLAVL